MCVNDLIVQGAKPLFFLDYIAIGKLNLKVTKELLKEMIEEEAVKAFGSDAQTRTNMSQDLKQRSKDAIKQQGIDNRERGIIGRMEKNLAKLADLTDIKSGNVFAVLKRLNKVIEDQIAELEGEQSSEK